jgi:Uma2 family endonuclease
MWESTMTSDVTAAPRSRDGGCAAPWGGSHDPTSGWRPIGPGDVEAPVLDRTAVTCRPMPLPAYLAAPADLRRAEYVNGWTVTRPAPTVRHQQTCLRLLRLLRRPALTPSAVVGQARWRIHPGDLVRVPDVLVLPRTPGTGPVTDAPRLVVEVLAGGDSLDLLLKSREYLRAGAEQLWVVDLVRRAVDVYASTGTGWARLARLTARRPCTTVEVTGLGPIELSLAEILG